MKGLNSFRSWLFKLSLVVIVASAMNREKDMRIKYEVTSFAERYDLFEVQDEICDKAWPEFMLHDPVANTNWMKFIEAYKDSTEKRFIEQGIITVVNF